MPEPRDSADRPTQTPPEIEVTPEMIEAGKNVLVYGYEPEFQRPEDAARRVFEAMLGAKLLGNLEQQS